MMRTTKLAITQFENLTVKSYLYNEYNHHKYPNTTYNYNNVPGNTRSIFLLNTCLSSVLVPQSLNEYRIRNLIEVLDHAGDPNQPEYWLMTARLAEAALLCAGHYADSCEFEAVGDLLVNPGKILIYLKGKKQPMQKKRHAKLSDQLYPQHDPGDNFVEWFKKNVILHVCEKPLLSGLYQMMEISGKFTDRYLAGMQLRMKKVADTIGFLSSWQIKTSQDLSERMERASPETKRFVHKNLCDFDRTLFNHLGEEISRFQEEPLYRSAYLRSAPAGIEQDRESVGPGGMH